MNWEWLEHFTDNTLERLQSLQLSPRVGLKGRGSTAAINSSEAIRRRRWRRGGECSGAHGGVVGGRARDRGGQRRRNGGATEAAAFRRTEGEAEEER